MWAYYALVTCKEGVVDMANKPAVAELSVLRTHYLTYSITSSLRMEFNSYKPYSSTHPEEL